MSARTAVVVLNFNGRPYLEPCFAAMTEQVAPGGRDLVLLDNGSSDGGPESVEALFPEVRVIRLGRNLGYAAAYNRAFAILPHPFLVVVNNDTRARPGWLAALVGAVDADPDVAAVTSKLVYAGRPGVVQSAGTLLLSDGGGGDRGSGEADSGQFEKREEVFAFNGGSALLRRAAIEEVGGFDERFFAYYEDTDLSWRLRLRGWKIIFEPASVIEHVHSATNREGSDFFTFHVDRNRLLMLAKNGSPSFIAGAVRKLGRHAAGASGPLGPRRTARHYGRLLGSLARHLPAELVARVRIRGRMTVGDQEIERWVFPREKWDARSA